MCDSLWPETRACDGNGSCDMGHCECDAGYTWRGDFAFRRGKSCIVNLVAIQALWMVYLLSCVPGLVMSAAELRGRPKRKHLILAHAANVVGLILGVMHALTKIMDPEHNVIGLDLLPTLCLFGVIALSFLGNAIIIANILKHMLTSRLHSRLLERMTSDAQTVRNFAFSTCFFMLCMGWVVIVRFAVRESYDDEAHTWDPFVAAFFMICTIVVFSFLPVHVITLSHLKALIGSLDPSNSADHQLLVEQQTKQWLKPAHNKRSEKKALEDSVLQDDLKEIMIKIQGAIDFVYQQSYVSLAIMVLLVFVPLLQSTMPYILPVKLAQSNAILLTVSSLQASHYRALLGYVKASLCCWLVPPRASCTVVPSSVDPSETSPASFSFKIGETANVVKTNKPGLIGTDEDRERGDTTDVAVTAHTVVDAGAPGSTPANCTVKGTRHVDLEP